MIYSTIIINRQQRVKLSVEVSKDVHDCNVARPGEWRLGKGPYLSLQNAISAHQERREDDQL